jgi:SAM-dependent methyltransferase
MSYYKRTSCRLCDSTHLPLALHYPPQPLADEYLRQPKLQPSYPLDLYLCDDCGCAQLLDVVSADEIYPQYTYETGSSSALVEHFIRYADNVLATVKPQPGSWILDIGSNDGTLLEAFARPGIAVHGIDPALGPATKANKKGISTTCGWFKEPTPQPYDIITANNIFANIDDLRSFTENIRNSLAPDGVFVFETFYLADLIDHMVFDFIYHEHLTAFALSPLIGFFQRLGMQVFDVQRVATKGGSIRVYVQHDSGKRPVSSDVAALVEWEYLRGLHKLAVFEQFAEKIERKKQQLVELLEPLKDAGKRIIGYGAGPTSTTLIYSWNLDLFLDCLFDDWPAKQNTYSPGWHLPVLTELPNYTDYCLILAWRYADQIMARNPQYRGTWIVPLPELRVIKS